MNVCLILLLLFSKVYSDSLLKEDPFYQEKLPELIGEDFEVRGTYTMAHAQPLHSLHPFTNDPFVLRLWDLCTGSLARAHFGKSNVLGPYFAKSIEKEKTAQGTDYLVTLREDLYWEPERHLSLKSKKVTAEDFKGYVDQFKDPENLWPHTENLRTIYARLSKITILDNTHFIVHWQGEEEIDQDQMTGELKPLPMHLFTREDFDPEDIRLVSCGPYQAYQINLSDKTIELGRNKNFFDQKAALIERIVFLHKSTSLGAWLAFKKGEIDSYYLPASQKQDYEQFLKSKVYLKQEQEGKKIESIQFLAKLYYFIAWNQNHPLLKDPNVRLALTYAIDREKMLEHLLKGEGVLLSGPFMPGRSSYDESIEPYPYDLSRSHTLLKESGFKKEKGIYTKEGERLSFSLIYYAGNDLHASVCQFISSSLREIGVDCHIQGLNESFWEKFQERDFDALCLGWTLPDQPEDLESIWSSKGPLNIVGLKDGEIDQWIQKLKTEKDLSHRIELYHQIHRKIHELSPYTFLYVPKQTFLYRERLKNVFIPKERPDLVTDADLLEPSLKVYYLQDEKTSL